jgi:hypothetical protein
MYELLRVNKGLHNHVGSYPVSKLRFTEPKDWRWSYIGTAPSSSAIIGTVITLVAGIA